MAQHAEKSEHEHQQECLKNKRKEKNHNKIEDFSPDWNFIGQPTQPHQTCFQELVFHEKKIVASTFSQVLRNVLV